jgi:hypothetical protein
MARAGKAKLTRQAHGAEREKGTSGGNGSTLVNRARETERGRESERAKETGTDRSAPLGSEREREGAHEGELPPARGLAGLSGPVGLLSPFLFLWIF